MPYPKIIAVSRNGSPQEIGAVGATGGDEGCVNTKSIEPTMRASAPRGVILSNVYT